MSGGEERARKGPEIGSLFEHEAGLVGEKAEKCRRPTSLDSFVCSMTGPHFVCFRIAEPHVGSNLESPSTRKDITEALPSVRL